MGRQLLQAISVTAMQIMKKSADRTGVASHVISRFITTTQNTLMFLGAATFVVIGIMLVKPGFASQIIGMSPLSPKYATQQKVHVSQLENWVETTAKPAAQADENEKSAAIEEKKRLFASFQTQFHRIYQWRGKAVLRALFFCINQPDRRQDGILHRSLPQLQSLIAARLAMLPTLDRWRSRPKHDWYVQLPRPPDRQVAR